MYKFLSAGPQPLQLVFDTSVEDKPETPGELPDPEKGGLGGARPLGLSTSNSPTLPRPPEHPPPPPPTITKKPSMPAPPPPPKLDQEVSHTRFILYLLSQFFLFVIFIKMLYIEKKSFEHYILNLLSDIIIIHLIINYFEKLSSIFFYLRGLGIGTLGYG